MSDYDVVEAIRNVDKKFCSEDGTLASEVCISAKEYSILRSAVLNRLIDDNTTNEVSND